MYTVDCDFLNINRRAYQRGGTINPGDLPEKIIAELQKSGIIKSAKKLATKTIDDKEMESMR